MTIEIPLRIEISLGAMPSTLGVSVVHASSKAHEASVSTASPKAQAALDELDRVAERAY